MKEVIDAAKKYAKEMLSDIKTVSDYAHAERVLRTSLYLAKKEKADVFIVSLAAILHDLDDVKVTGVDSDDCPNVRAFFATQPVEEEIVEEVCYIINNISFSKRKSVPGQDTIEGMVVQDADRLDSIGAIGIARAFTHGGIIKRELYDGNVNNENTIKHFYERLLKVKDTLMTDTAKDLADNRHNFIEEFIQQFYYEWNI